MVFSSADRNSNGLLLSDLLSDLHETSPQPVFSLLLQGLISYGRAQSRLVGNRNFLKWNRLKSAQLGLNRCNSAGKSENQPIPSLFIRFFSRKSHKTENRVKISPVPSDSELNRMIFWTMSISMLLTKRERKRDQDNRQAFDFFIGVLDLNWIDPYVYV